MASLEPPRRRHAREEARRDLVAAQGRRPASGEAVSQEQAMNRTESYTDKTFIVADADARLRKPNNLMEFERDTAADPLPEGEQAGNFKHRQGHEGQGDKVKVDKVNKVKSSFPPGARARSCSAIACRPTGPPSSAGRRRETSTASSSTRRWARSRLRAMRASSVKPTLREKVRTS